MVHGALWAEAWSAGKDDADQWVWIDAGSAVVVEGVLAAGRVRATSTSFYGIFGALLSPPAHNAPCTVLSTSCQC